MKKLFQIFPGILLLTGALLFSCQAKAGIPKDIAASHPVPAVPEDKGELVSPEASNAVFTYTIEHPNAKDSAIVVSIVNGVMSTVTVANPKLGVFLTKVFDLGSLVVAAVLGVWRWISRRRIRRNNPGVDLKIYD